MTDRNNIESKVSITKRTLSLSGSYAYIDHVMDMPSRTQLSIGLKIEIFYIRDLFKNSQYPRPDNQIRFIYECGRTSVYEYGDEIIFIRKEFWDLNRITDEIRNHGLTYNEDVTCVIKIEKAISKLTRVKSFRIHDDQVDDLRSK
ncbi:hypothetical protein BGZ76_000356 [Entomortierella beljakovae]|nr:hypothetical protein BGZ76_000356 [Entomortierella beljakovae]